MKARTYSVLARFLLPPIVSLCVGVFLGCGENLTGPGASFGPPRDVRALSVNESTVRLEWSPADGATDSAFQGYVVQWGANEVIIPKTTLTYNVSSLSPGETLFILYSRKTDGTRSDGAVIRWAPATRFSTVYSLFEYIQLDPSNISGLSVGTQTTDAFTMAVNGSVAPVLDLYCFGGDGVVERPLSLWSASRFGGSFSPVRFSEIAHSSPSLDLPLSSFPDETTFFKDSIAVQDNMIYYVRVVGDNLQVLYARLHVRVRSGTSYPNRIIDVQISLQRVPGVGYAQNVDEVLPPVCIWRQTYWGIKQYQLRSG